MGEINPLSLLLTTHPQMALSTLSKHIRHSISLLIVFIDVILHVKSGQILFFLLYKLYISFHEDKVFNHIRIFVAFQIVYLLFIMINPEHVQTNFSECLKKNK